MKVKSQTIYSLLMLCLISTTNSFALTNSTPAEAPLFNNVVQIKSEAPDANGDTAPSFCVATLIHRNVLATAAHCVKSAFVSGYKKIDIQVGHYKYITRKTDGQTMRLYVTKHQFSKIVNIELPRGLADKLHQRGERASISPTEDFAILWWNDETPELADTEVASLTTPAEHLALTKNIIAYPLQTVTVNPFVDMSMDTKRMALMSGLKWKGYIYAKGSSRVEEGDSGAPLFAIINNRPKLFGVVKGRATTIFDNWDAFSSIHPHLCQISTSLPTFIKLETCKI